MVYWILSKWLKLFGEQGTVQLFPKTMYVKFCVVPVFFYFVREE